MKIKETALGYFIDPTYSELNRIVRLHKGEFIDLNRTMTWSSNTTCYVMEDSTGRGINKIEVITQEQYLEYQENFKRKFQVK